MQDKKEETRKRKKEGWIEVSFSIEALAMKDEVVKSSLLKHMEDLSKVGGVYVYESSFSDAILVKKPLKGIEEAYSQIAYVKFFVKDLMTLVSMAMTFGPSSVEILCPDRKEIKISEIQNMINLVSGVVHQFAAAGAGGIVITPDKKPSS